MRTLLSQTMNLEYKCDKIDLIDTGMGVHIEFDKLNGQKEQYFIIQKHFEDDEDFNGISYVELEVVEQFEIAGHYKVNVELSRTECKFLYEDVELTFKLKIDEEKYEELKSFLNILASVKTLD